MFSFHKPKIYRSNLGCCICKAKSSSSRFTDSKKYENEFEHCFRIEEKRSGEICNACVLLVKRWKKLSPENRSVKHWHHVVDARAGPGTKLTGGRRLNSASPSAGRAEPGTSGARKSGAGAGSSRCGSDSLPLSSSQAPNQLSASGFGSTSGASGPTGGSSKRFSTNKARAIDTNVSTFTFGEPIRRNYMSSESYGGPPGPHKAYSSLNSSTFESVIKRFRQRQHQEQAEAERRQQNRRRRQQQQQQPQAPQQQQQQQQQPQHSEPKPEATTSSEQPVPLATAGAQATPVKEEARAPSAQVAGGRRVKRSSESIGALAIDGVRVTSLLDASLWRKERVCCGTIFRGLFNEVAISPKLLKPCQCRMRALQVSREAHSGEATAAVAATVAAEAREQEEEEEEAKSESGSFQDSSLPRPRATKSGSISSCDSNTSGTGSMEQPLDESRPARGALEARQKRQLAAKPASSRHSLRHAKQQQATTDSSIYLRAAKQALHSPSSSSGASSLPLNNAGDDDEDELELEEELEEEEEDEEEEDADEDDEVLLHADAEMSSSSVDSLAGVEGNKNSSVGAMG